MKTIKEESYKGHNIRVDAEYKEDAVKYSNTPEANEDSIKIELYVKRGDRPLSRRVDEDSITFRKTEKVKAFSLLNEKTNNLINKAKKDIDKKLREKEITDGLPESLLKDSKEKEEIDLYLYILDKFGIAPVFVGELSEPEIEEFKNNKEMNFRGYSSGGLDGGGGKLAVLHEDELILNKEETENLLQSAVESATLLGKSLSEVMDSYIEFAKQEDVDESKKFKLRKMQEILDEKTLAAKEEGIAIGNALKTILSRISNANSIKEQFGEATLTIREKADIEKIVESLSIFLKDLNK